MLCVQFGILFKFKFSHVRDFLCFSLTTWCNLYASRKVISRGLFGKDASLPGIVSNKNIIALLEVEIERSGATATSLLNSPLIQWQSFERTSNTNASCNEIHFDWELLFFVYLFLS